MDLPVRRAAGAVGERPGCSAAAPGLARPRTCRPARRCPRSSASSAQPRRRRARRASRRTPRGPSPGSPKSRRTPRGTPPGPVPASARSATASRASRFSAGSRPEACCDQGELQGRARGQPAMATGQPRVPDCGRGRSDARGSRGAHRRWRHAGSAGRTRPRSSWPGRRCWSTRWRDRGRARGGGGRRPGAHRPAGHLGAGGPARRGPGGRAAGRAGPVHPRCRGGVRARRGHAGVTAATFARLAGADREDRTAPYSSTRPGGGRTWPGCTGSPRWPPRRPEREQGLSVRRLVGGLRLAEVPALGGETRDVDTWADLRDLRGVTGSDFRPMARTGCQIRVTYKAGTRDPARLDRRTLRRARDRRGGRRGADPRPGPRSRPRRGEAGRAGDHVPARLRRCPARGQPDEVEGLAGRAAALAEKWAGEDVSEPTTSSRGRVVDAEVAGLAPGPRTLAHACRRRHRARRTRGPRRPPSCPTRSPGRRGGHRRGRDRREPGGHPAAAGPLPAATRGLRRARPGVLRHGQRGRRGGDRLAGGRRVCALLAGGGYAEKVVVPAGQVMPVPGRASTW